MIKEVTFLALNFHNALNQQLHPLVEGLEISLRQKTFQAQTEELTKLHCYAILIILEMRWPQGLNSQPQVCKAGASTIGFSPSIQRAHLLACTKFCLGTASFIFDIVSYLS